MSVSPYLLLSVYCVVIAAVSLIAANAAAQLRLSHTRIQLIMSGVAGLMLGVACYHLLPHSVASFASERAVDQAMWWLVVGLVLMLLLLRLFHFHQHDFSGVDAIDTDHAHSDCAAHGHPEQRHAPGVSSTSGLGLVFGMSIHAIVDGLALAAAVFGAAHGEAGLLGFGVFLAVVLHKPLDALSVSAMLSATRLSKATKVRTNIMFALMCPVGALLFLAGFTVLEGYSHSWVGIMLALSAGSFICIALSDLLPEVHFHSHDRTKLTIVFVLGLALAYSIGQFEPEGAHSMHEHEGRLPVQSGEHHHG